MLDPGTSLDMEHEAVNKITGSSRSGTKILQITSLNDICGSEIGGPRQNCEEWWESGHVEKGAWAALPSVFRLSTYRGFSVEQ